MNIALEKTEEFVNGKHRRSYGDAFVRGNNGMLYYESEVEGVPLLFATCKHGRSDTELRHFSPSPLHLRRLNCPRIEKKKKYLPFARDLCESAAHRVIWNHIARKKQRTPW